MTLMEFFGCTFIAFGPSLAMFWFTVSHDPLKVIIFIAGAFFWLLSLLLSSILWFAVVPLRHDLAFGLVFSVIFQELFRFAYFKLLKKAEDGLQKFTDAGQTGNRNVFQLAKSRHVVSYVAGLGFGVMSGAFSLINVLADASGPGTVGLKGDPDYFFLTSAFLTLAFILLHTWWSVIFFHACQSESKSQLISGVAVVIVSHLIVSCLTLVNRNGGAMYAASLIPAYIVMFIMMGIAARIAGLTTQTVKSGLRPSVLRVPAE